MTSDPDRLARGWSWKEQAQSWLIVLAVLGTAGVTVWAMAENRVGLGWGSDPGYGYLPQQVPQALSPGIMARNQGMLFPVAGTAAAPGIRPLPIHQDRGVCTTCHSVLTNRNQPIPRITALSVRRHESRGVCSNCHLFSLTPKGAAAPGLAGPGFPVAARPAGPVAAGPGQAMPRPRPEAALPTEGEWLGLEVAPITLLTAAQYSIPFGTPGLVVTDSEPPASDAGVKVGDVLQSINGIPVGSMPGFLAATRRGALSRGTLALLREGRGRTIAVAPRAGPERAGRPAAARPAPVPEGEWLGLEVAPITPATASQYGIPAGTPGLIVLEAEGAAATRGIQEGDVIQSIDQVALQTITDFFRVTNNGTSAGGMLEILRQGQRLTVWLARAPAPGNVGAPGPAAGAGPAMEPSLRPAGGVPGRR